RKQRPAIVIQQREVMQQIVRKPRAARVENLSTKSPKPPVLRPTELMRQGARVLFVHLVRHLGGHGRQSERSNDDRDHMMAAIDADSAHGRGLPWRRKG